MKLHLLIVAIFGFGAGAGIRVLSQSETIDSEEKVSLARPSPPSTPDLAQLTIQDPIAIRDDLTSEEILILPESSIRFAELSLWLTKANSDEIRSLWKGMQKSRDWTWQDQELVMSAWIRVNLADAFDEVRGTDLERYFHHAHATANPTEALAFAKKSSPTAYASALRIIAKSDPDFAIKLLDQIAAKDLPHVRSGIIIGLIERDPETAYKMAKENEKFHNDVIFRWAAFDPRRAFSYGLLHQDNHAFGLVDRLMKIDPEFTIEEIDSLPTGAFKSQLLIEQLEFVAQSDPIKALEMARKQSPDFRAAALGKVAETSMAENPELAVEIFKEIFRQPSDNQSNQALAHNLVWGHDWVQKLLLNHPERIIQISGEVGKAQQGSAVRLWAVLSPRDAHQWIMTQPKGDRFDNVADSLSLNPPHSSLQTKIEASEIISGIRNRERRIEATKRFMGGWHNLDSGSFNLFLQSEKVTAEQLEIASELLDKK